MKLIDAIYHRRAIRNYANRPVDRETLSTVIAAAIQAPSSMNRQPWSFAVVTDRSLLDRASDRAKTQLLGSPSTGTHLAALRETLESPSFNIFPDFP